MRQHGSQHRFRPAVLGVQALVSVFCLASPAIARQGAAPASERFAALPLDAVAVIATPLMDAEAERTKQPEAAPGAPFRFAEPHAVDITPATHGTWEDLPNGGRLWRLRIASPGATDLNFGFRRYRLPRGATLHFISETEDYAQGPYTSGDNKPHGELWSPVIPGDRAVLELYVPAGARGRPVLLLGSINRGFRDLFRRQMPLVKGPHSGPAKAGQGSCNIDSICPLGDAWRDEIQSVGGYSLGGSIFCTGTMIMDVPRSFRPFFLTAYHCGLDQGQAPSVVVYWNFASPVCGQLSGGSLADNQSGATFRAGHRDTDACLIELDSVPAPTSNVYYAGWDRSGGAVSGTLGIHHPDGQEKALSSNNDALTTVSSCILAGPAGTHWEVDDWESGTTEPGSSGSGLWDTSTHLLVGILSGGSASCSMPNESDCYGKFSVAWDSGSSPATRLSDWLDPDGLGVSMVAGAYPGVDLPKPTLLHPVGGESFSTSSVVQVGWTTNGAPTSVVAVVEYNESCGATEVSFSDDMESGVNGWTVNHGAGSLDWSQVTTDSHSGITSWFAVNAASVTDQRLVSPQIAVPDRGVLSVWHRFDLETDDDVAFDGGVIEVSTNGPGGPWTDINSLIVQHGYFRPVDTGYSNPLGGRLAYTGDSVVFIRTLADLAAYAGDNIRLRFRLGTDSSANEVGWWVDDVEVYGSDPWEDIGPVTAGSTNYPWLTPGVRGSNYCVRVKLANSNDIDSAWCVGSAFTLTHYDADGDCMPDAWELIYGFDTNFDDSAGDADMDNAVNIAEYIADTIPTNAASVFSIVAISNDTDRLIYAPSSSARVYALERATNLLDGVWVNVQTGLVGTGGILELIDTNAVPSGAYRVRVAIP